MEKDLTIRGLRLHYDVTGPEDGAPVVLMHGWGCTHSTVRSIAQTLEGYMRVYNFDLPGHGASDEPDSVWGVEDFTTFMEEAIRALGIERPTLIGHSFGGRISILMGSRHDIDRIVLVDAAGIKPLRSLTRLSSWKYYWKVYSYKTIKVLLPRLFGKKGQEWLDRYRNKAGSADYRNSSPRMKAVMSKCVNEDLKHVMPLIKAPTLLIWGENDTATPLSDAHTMNRLIPDSGIVSFPGCGHYSFLDNPFGFRAAITEFFKDKRVKS